ncbi:MAG: DUF4350 domain-containing protein [Cellvibrio sp.]|uniref:DUF4350 domain-containing protein n=1 Tax=Cellvibrio sp. TaxID=1965322 RepID=UPI0031B2731A
MSSSKNLSVRQRWLLLGAIALILIGAGYWWYTQLEWEEKEVDLGYSKEAIQNDFLAAEIFLRKHGIQATTVKNLSLLDKHSWRNIQLGAQDTIVIVNGYKTLSEDRYDSLYEWVEGGGTLITSTQNPFVGTHTSEEDVLLSDFNIELAPEEKDEDDRDALERLADDLEEAVDGKSKPDDEEDSDDETTDSNDNRDETKESSANKTNSDSADKVEKTTDTTKSKNKKNKKKAEEEKPENYYRCSMAEPPVEITFAGEEKPLAFDFSNSRQFIYYDYAEPDEEQDSDTPEDETSSEQDENPATETPEEDGSFRESLEAAVASGESSDNENYQYRGKHENLLYFDIGDGSITITSDNHIWANHRIDCHDHAYGLWRLVNPEGRVWFLVNQDAPSLATIIWRNASYGVLAALLALVLWLWAKSLRFGPVLVIEQTGRRSLAEHIYASAMLLWRKQEHPQLLGLLRKEILDRLDDQHPNLAQATQDERALFLQELAGINAADIQKALYSIALRHPQDFAAAIAHLQTIRKQLHGSKL